MIVGLCFNVSNKGAGKILVILFSGREQGE